MEDATIQILTIIVSNLLVILTFFGISISLHIAIRNDIKEVQKESKDFHGRLISIEENRNRDRR